MSRRRALLRYLAARLALAPLMLWLIASLVFLLLRLAPGDPIDALLGTRAPESARAALRATKRVGIRPGVACRMRFFCTPCIHPWVRCVRACTRTP